jgi:hypothetical protein
VAVTDKVVLWEKSIDRLTGCPVMIGAVQVGPQLPPG